jgi:hypothetical protein
MHERMHTPNTKGLCKELLDMFRMTMRPDPLPFKLRPGFNYAGLIRGTSARYELVRSFVEHKLEDATEFPEFLVRLNETIRPDYKFTQQEAWNITKEMNDKGRIVLCPEFDPPQLYRIN